ncbi:hypothetical protein [Streptomyces platensis]|uniref:hypothetical protein n=1 Tax=Streptomyces platensis TaxID=58346 RepID=UPI00378B14C2
MSEKQREQQPQASTPQQQAADPCAEFVTKGVVAAIGGAVSGTARALWTHLLGDE